MINGSDQRSESECDAEDEKEKIVIAHTIYEDSDELAVYEFDNINNPEVNLNVPVYIELYYNCSFWDAMETFVKNCVQSDTVITSVKGIIEDWKENCKDEDVFEVVNQSSVKKRVKLKENFRTAIIIAATNAILEDKLRIYENIRDECRILLERAVTGEFDDTLPDHIRDFVSMLSVAAVSEQEDAEELVPVSVDFKDTHIVDNKRVFHVSFEGIDLTGVSDSIPVSEDLDWDDADIAEESEKIEKVVEAEETGLTAVSDSIPVSVDLDWVDEDIPDENEEMALTCVGDSIPVSEDLDWVDENDAEEPDEPEDLEESIEAKEISLEEEGDESDELEEIEGIREVEDEEGATEDEPEEDKKVETLRSRELSRITTNANVVGDYMEYLWDWAEGWREGMNYNELEQWLEDAPKNTLLMIDNKDRNILRKKLTVDLADCWLDKVILIKTTHPSQKASFSVMVDPYIKDKVFVRKARFVPIGLMDMDIRIITVVSRS